LQNIKEISHKNLYKQIWISLKEKYQTLCINKQVLQAYKIQLVLYFKQLLYPVIKIWMT